MRLALSLFLLLILGIQIVEPAFAARRDTGRRGPPRSVVAVHKAWPLKRAPRLVIVRAPRAEVTTDPLVFLTPVAFGAHALRRLPARGDLVWEHGEVLHKAEDWTVFTSPCAKRGRDLFLEISAGRAQFDWAEIVFDNGDAQVVDFAEKTHGPGFYPLHDFREGRRVEHVRMVARARTPEAKLVLRLAR